MHYNIKSTSEPYAELIAGYVVKQFPQYVGRDKGAMLDLLTDAITASGQIRFGPKPRIENLAAMRAIMAAKIEASEPIPFAVPWGSRKANGGRPDMAELGAIKTLSCLRDRVTKFYIPGVEFGLRAEDLAAHYVYTENPEVSRQQSWEYVQALRGLVRATATEGFIYINPESSYGVSAQQFEGLAEQVRPLLEKHIANPDDAYAINDLRDAGWKGALSRETIGYYLDTYAKLYPETTTERKQFMLARYFAAALARAKLGLNGSRKQWNGQYLELSFVKPIPGIEPERYPRRINYRTIPESITSNHMPPWRAKGYLQIENDAVTTKLASFNEPHTYNPNTITLESGSDSQVIQADYVIV
jgi:hypothetical protein